MALVVVNLCTLSLVLVALIGCQSLPEVAMKPEGPVKWPERLVPGSLSMGDLSGESIRPFGHYRHGHLAGWYRPSGGPLSILSVVTRGALGTVPDQGVASVAMSITNGKGLKGSARVHIRDDERNTAVFLRHPDKPKGVAILLTSLSLFSKSEAKIWKRLSERDWLSIAIMPSTDLMGLSRLPPLTNEDAPHFGSLIDHHLAERAYAVESVLEFLTQSDPTLAALPKVLIGASLGALAAPAVATRLGDVEAMVMIGGGTNVANITVDSSLRLIKLEPSIRAGEGRRVLQVTDQAMALDPGKLAIRFREMPCLLIDGRLDHIVPATYGQRLYRRLGEPERWRYPVGHLLLFSVILPQKVDAIIDWLEAKSPNGCQSES